MSCLPNRRMFERCLGAKAGRWEYFDPIAQAPWNMSRQPLSNSSKITAKKQKFINRLIFFGYNQGHILHRRSRNQNKAIAQKLGILGEKVTSMAGLKIKKVPTRTCLERHCFHFTWQISIKIVRSPEWSATFVERTPVERCAHWRTSFLLISQSIYPSGFWCVLVCG